MKLRDLVNSTADVRAQQYPTNKIGSLDLIYYKRNKQLYITGQAFPYDRSVLRPYKMNLVFSGIEFSDTQTKLCDLPYYKSEHKLECYIQRPTFDHNVQCRCQCPDFYFMWEYWDKRNRALLGPHKPYVRVPGSTRPPVNPSQAPGMCKHVFGMTKVLTKNGLIERNQQMASIFNRPTRPIL